MTIVATQQLMAGVRPPMSVVVKPLSHPNSNYRYPITKVSFNRTSLVHFPQLSLSIPSRNSESRFISVARSDNYYVDQFHIIKEEEKPNPSSAPVNEQQGREDQIFMMRCQKRLLLGLEGQMLSIMVAPFAYFFGMLTSKFAYCATLGGIITAYISLYFDRKMCKHLRLIGEDESIANDPLKAPTRDDVIKHVKWAIPMNLFGLGAIIQGIRGKFGLVHPGYANCGPESIVKYKICFLQGAYAVVINHLLGLAFSLVLLRWVTKPPSANMDAKFSG